MGDMEEDSKGNRNGASQEDITLHMDMDNRDPNDLNNHIKTNFEEVIGEPDGAHSADKVWVASYKCFHTGHQCCYTCLTWVCAVPFAFCWGCYFSCVTFMHIWSVTPCLKVFATHFGVLKRFFSTMVHCWCDPCYEATALMFTKIYINIVQGAQPYRERTYSGLNMYTVPDVQYPAYDKGVVHGDYESVHEEKIE